MLEDVLDFAALTLVDGGRLCMWMPTANEEGNEVDVPKHPSLRLEAVSTQAFNKCMHFHLSNDPRGLLTMDRVTATAYFFKTT